MVDPNQWFYIWLSYGVTAVALVGYWLRLRLKQRAAERALADRNQVHPAPQERSRGMQ